MTKTERLERERILVLVKEAQGPVTAVGRNGVRLWGWPQVV